MHTVLMVDDDDFLRQVIKSKLESEGYRMLQAVSRPTLFSQLGTNEIHLILLDIMLDKENGIELITEIREHTEAPIIMLSSKDHLFDKIIALEMGADDYICKPAEPKELLSRIKANIRRYISGSTTVEAKAPQKFRFGPWLVDISNFCVCNDDGHDAGLTKDEFDLLVVLAKSPNVIFTREKIFEILRAEDFDTFDRAIDIQIMRIRKKIGDDARNPVFIRTVRKVGYQFVAPVTEVH